jgi:hypothetical protein
MLNNKKIIATLFSLLIILPGCREKSKPHLPRYKKEKPIKVYRYDSRDSLKNHNPLQGK